MATNRDEKETRTKVGVGDTEIDYESRSKSDDSRDRGRYGASADYDDFEHDDYGDRARANAREFGESVKEAGSSVRREGTDIFSGYCDLIGGIFVGIGEAIAPRYRSGSSGSARSNACAPVSACSYGGASRPASSDEPVQSSSYSSGGGRVRASRTEVRRPR
jgi:hypothetical protein